MPEIIPNLHPVVVHFPIALISLSALFHLAAKLTGGNPCSVHCAILAHTTLWIGALSAFFAVYFGWQAFNSVNHDDASHVAMLIHRDWALGTLAGLAILAGWDLWRNKVDSLPAWWFAGAIIGAWSLVATTAWHGGELVYRHGLGVMSLPKDEVTEHLQDQDHRVMHEDEDNVQLQAMPDNPSQNHSQHKHSH